MKAAEANGQFRYVPNESVSSNDILAEEKEKPVVPPPRIEPQFQPQMKPVPSQPIIPAVPLIPTPVAPAAAPVPKPTSMMADEFLDPELDLELEGMNLDGDDEVGQIV